MCPTYDHVCSLCEGEFEDIYSMKESPPTLCPLCGEDGGVKRVMSIPAIGIVELTGRDLTMKLRAEGKQLVQKAKQNENTLADMVGHDKLQANTVVTEKVKSELSKVAPVKKKKSE